MSVMIGLLLAAVKFVGLKIVDISALALQRSILALIIAIGSPCVTLEHEYTGLEFSPLIQYKILWPLFIKQLSFCIKMFIFGI